MRRPERVNSPLVELIGLVVLVVCYLLVATRGAIVGWLLR